MAANTKQLRMKLPKQILGMLLQHQDELGLSSTKFMERVSEEFLEFYDALNEDEREEFRLYQTPSDSGERYQPYLKVETKDRLDAIADGQKVAYMHAYWTAILKYMQRHDLFEKDYDQTPSVIKVVLADEEFKLMKHWVVDEEFKSLSHLYEHAIENWIRKREAFSGPFYADYRARPTDAEEEELTSAVMAIPMSLHATMSVWANKDNQSVRTVAYNALADLMDDKLAELLEAESKEAERGGEDEDEGRPG
jgi:hypothetical protein